MYKPSHFDESRPAVLHRIIREHPLGRLERRPWKRGEAPPDDVDTMLHNLAGIEVAIMAPVGKGKVIRNKEPRDRGTAAGNPDARGRPALARDMRAALAPLHEGSAT